MTEQNNITCRVSQAMASLDNALIAVADAAREVADSFEIQSGAGWSRIIVDGDAAMELREALRAWKQASNDALAASNAEANLCVAP